ncbi:MAG: ABC transporter permease [Sporolactobacillus sp.]
MKSAWIVLREQISNFYLIRRLSIFEIKSENNNNYLGWLWVIINPLIQIGIYWLVFGQIIGKKAVMMDGHKVPYILWLISGIFVWFFINPSITRGSKSIYSRIRFIAKMKFPMSTIPSYVIFANFYQHLMLTGIIIIILQFSDRKLSLYIFQLPYFMFSTFAFLLSVTLALSTLTTLIRDLQYIVTSVMHMMIYVTPFLWSPDRLGKMPILQTLLKLNPMYYIVEGYREAMLGFSWYPVEHGKYTIYFWVIILILFIFGSTVHVKFRNHFLDYL